MLDSARFPLLAGYLKGLPEGLDSYPECQGKASLISSSLAGLDTSVLHEGLPETLQELIAAPPSAGLWSSAVHCDAVFFAVCDHFYPTEAAVKRWTYERTMTTAQNPIYRVLLRVPGPSLLLKAGEKVHALFQRGTAFNVDVSRGYAKVTLTFPPLLHVGLNLVANVALWQALVELTGGKHVKSELVSTTASTATYVVTYD